MNKGKDQDSDEEGEGQSLREEVERKYFPERCVGRAAALRCAALPATRYLSQQGTPNNAPNTPFAHLP